ncbi:Spo0E like sporulation regulatory protein [Hydrogenispora ethanolica]|jgi:hypothetical protein|uniref:Spo0E like sporulation regulatory protein n=1 Tax=Hydrogenispora ethanolica TaxID=1082276 RepID=A0A4R1RXF3_HYDET|nr:aspartyl-phosphate phosphatase Spo0E family protein [Hydrogenispora ethanolica]TCL70860.1 Spo0E like sporulation regulatory protein [Hydrogenispora ethanolica]
MSIGKEPGSLKTLREQIKIARDRMQQLWDEKGHTDTEVINASIELDDLINEYHRKTD